MKLIVPDRSSVAGGVESLCVSVLPELAQLGVDVMWAVPEHRREKLDPKMGVLMMGVEWPRGSMLRLLSGASRRLGATRFFDRLYLSRIQHLQRSWKASSVLYPWILDEPIPRVKALPRSIIVYDRNWVRFPQNFSKLPAALDRQVEAWMGGADHIITISESVCADLADRWPEFKHKIYVIPLAASVCAVDPQELREQGAVRAIPTFYYPATVSPHKGHSVLIDAMLMLKTKGLEFEVILSGHGSEEFAAEAKLKWPQLLSNRTLIGLGYVDRASVKQTYCQASAVVLPSLFEGFGLPLSEALAHGTPAICSDLEPYREQVYRLDAARHVTLVTSGSARALAHAMADRIALGPPGHRERVAIASLAARWTWRDVALAYRNLLCGSN